MTVSAFGVDHGEISKADRRHRGATLVGAGAATAGIGEYASAHYNVRHGGHTGIKNLGVENVGTHRAYVKTPNDPSWHDHNLNLGRAEGSVIEEKRVLRHLSRGVVGSNGARLAGYGTMAAGAGLVALGSRKRKKIAKRRRDDLSPSALQGAGVTATTAGLGLRQLYTHKTKVEGDRAAMADKLHAKTATMTRMTDAAKERRYGFHEARARQARHFEDVYRASAKTGTGIALTGGALLGVAAYGKHLQRGNKVSKSAFGVEHPLAKADKRQHALAAGSIGTAGAAGVLSGRPIHQRGQQVGLKRAAEIVGQQAKPYEEKADRIRAKAVRLRPTAPYHLASVDEKSARSHANLARRTQTELKTHISEGGRAMRGRGAVITGLAATSGGLAYAHHRRNS